MPRPNYIRLRPRMAEIGSPRDAAVVAITDCAPSSSAITQIYSGSAQTRALLSEARLVAPHWLGVHVPREWNTDADRLSHPSCFEAVCRDVPTRTRVVSLHIPQEMWAALRRAIRLPPAAADLEWQP